MFFVFVIRVCHVFVETTTRMVARTLPLSKRDSHASPGCHRPPDREPLPPVSFRHEDQEHGTLRGAPLLQSHPRGFQVFLQLQRQYPDLCYKGPSLLLFWIKWSLAHWWKTWRLGKKRSALVRRSPGAKCMNPPTNEAV